MKRGERRKVFFLLICLQFILTSKIGKFHKALNALSKSTSFVLETGMDAVIEQTEETFEDALSSGLGPIIAISLFNPVRIFLFFIIDIAHVKSAALVAATGCAIVTVATAATAVVVGASLPVAAIIDASNRTHTVPHV
jgi:hypothetical protein